MYRFDRTGQFSGRVQKIGLRVTRSWVMLGSWLGQKCSSWNWQDMISLLRSASKSRAEKLNSVSGWVCQAKSQPTENSIILSWGAMPPMNSGTEYVVPTKIRKILLGGYVRESKCSMSEKTPAGGFHPEPPRIAYFQKVLNVCRNLRHISIKFERFFEKLQNFH